jgi:hypothetical protein
VAVLNSEKLGTGGLSVISSTGGDALCGPPYSMTGTTISYASPVVGGVLPVMLSAVAVDVTLLWLAGIRLRGLPREEASGAEDVPLSAVIEGLASGGVA